MQASNGQAVTQSGQGPLKLTPLNLQDKTQHFTFDSLSSKGISGEGYFITSRCDPSLVFDCKGIFYLFFLFSIFGEI